MRQITVTVFSFIVGRNEAQSTLVQGQEALDLGDKFQQSDSAVSVLTCYMHLSPSPTCTGEEPAECLPPST